MNEKMKSALYWLGFLLSYMVSLMVFGMIVAFIFHLPNTMVGGMLAYTLIACGMLFTAEDETLEIIKYLVTKGEKGSLTGSKDKTEEKRDG